VNRLALSYLDLAIRAEEENRQLRELMSNLVLAIARNRDWLADARRELIERFPEEEGPA
jgi:hypothetical protein